MWSLLRDALNITKRWLIRPFSILSPPPPHKVIGDFKLAGNPIKMSTYEDPDKRGDIPDLDEHREKIIKEFVN